MTKHQLEKFQVLIYLSAILSGLMFGATFSGLNQLFETLLWPTLGLLMYATFTQISLSKLRRSFQDLRFISAALLGNFILIPLIVWGMISLLPENEGICFGVALVLLVPCTDWFITFTQLGGGDTEQAVAFSPLSLLFQILLLPVYLFLFFGNELTVTLATNDMFLAFAGIIILPITLAYFTDLWAKSIPQRQYFITKIAWFPVPLLAIVIFMISASQSHVLFEAGTLLWYPAACFVLFLAVAPPLAILLSKMVDLPVRRTRVLAFSFGSRNSFVVLPLALALPQSYEIAVFVVVLQSLIELFGMALYVWLIPKLIFKSK